MEETLGKRIMAHRKRLKLTQDQLAEKLGVTAQAVSKWENDQSCPDINMLPRLAQLFGTTTDALLGQEIVYDTEVVGEEEGKSGWQFQRNNGCHGTVEATIENRENGWQFQWDSGRRGAIGFAIFVLLVGMLLLSDKILGWQVGFWSICWPSALLVFGVFQICKRFNFTSIACTLLGSYFLLKNLGFVELHISGDLIFPALILIFGLCLLVDALRKPKGPKFHIKNHGDNSKMKQNFTQDGERFDCSLSFGQTCHRVCLPRLSEGNADCSFGELTVDLTGCDEIADGCTVNIGCHFGALNLIVPKAYRVQCESGASFGAIETQGDPDSNCSGTIRLTGVVSFGGVEIHYV